MSCKPSKSCDPYVWVVISYYTTNESSESAFEGMYIYSLKDHAEKECLRRISVLEHWNFEKILDLSHQVLWYHKQCSIRMFRRRVII